MLSEISQTEEDKYCMGNLTNKKQIKKPSSWIQRTDCWSVTGGGWEGEEQSRQRESEVQTPGYKINNPENIMYSMGTTVNNAVLYIWEFLREQNLKFLITRKKFSNYVWRGILTRFILVIVL